MAAEKLLIFLAGITHLSEDFKIEVMNGVHHEYYFAHQILQAEGQPENRLWYIKTGFARSYLYDETGNEHTIRFWNENEFIFSSAGYWRFPAVAYIEILENSNLDSLAYEKLDSVLTLHPETQSIAKAVIRKYILQEYRHHVLMSYSAEERYIELRRSKPDIFKKAPLRMIASYLNMSRETLSRIISKSSL